MFGSYVYSQAKARDLDLLVVVERLNDIHEKSELELGIKRALRDVSRFKPIDVVVLDLEMLRENMKPGTMLSGLVCGYKVLYDEIGLPTLIEDLVKALALEDVVLIKRGRRLSISAHARAKLLNQKW
ncbi:MAG: hypothetical protein QXO97_05150 [Candidatus Nezhaarchaeales archaeon]